MSEQLNFTQFAGQHGYVDDYSVLDHNDLSPSGHVSKRGRKAAQDRQQGRAMSNIAGHVAYQAAVDAGDVTDPSGKYIPTPKDQTPEAKAARSRIVQLQSRVAFLETVGLSSKTGKLRPSYKREIDHARHDIAMLGQTSIGN